ncbi:MAG: AAA domain-containing protein [Actinobacteria bacterium]|uniref:Unannotated protein n=1 Tax=freshwater metagenome TaxID=449393 RepID=A0A6J7W8V1_9ZZZZ|nr:AAA domain-containing protein [Actinomycetota bacterium]
MLPLKTILKVGTILGEGVRNYTVEKVTNEAIYLRGHPDAQRGEKGNRKGALRIIPTVVIEDILHGLESKVITLDDIVRKRGNEKTDDLFSLLGVDHDKFILGYDSTIYKICELCFNNATDTSIRCNSAISTNTLPKPFLLLAGISGTGKTRFVREQASAHYSGDLSNYCLIPVRPDWHEPSDLLGYISRIGQGGSRYVVTDLLRFVSKVWQDAWASATAEELVCKAPADMTPYWLCLDEMNLAPVEQYFADYLSILETRKWQDGSYHCDPLLKSDTIKQLDSAGQQALRADLQLDDVLFDDLWNYFVNVGIPLPPNLIVAGTVNMDETTHGFSRKVVDRAFTIDFGVFYPNNFADYFEPATRPKTLGFPVLSQVTKVDLDTVFSDKDGAKSIAFLNAINIVLKGTPFELAYRALNELLLAVVCFNPKNETELQAVWDDFLMSKVLPRIDGDTDKLKSIGDDGKLQANDDDSSLLTQLLAVIELQFSVIWSKERPDLLRENINKNVLEVDCRAKQKLDWMQKRLADNSFTTFWP